MTGFFILKYIFFTHLLNFSKIQDCRFDNKKLEYIRHTNSYFIMRYSELNYRGKTYTSSSEINDILIKEKFYWLIDSEIENAQLEIKNNTLIWKNGSFYTGDWYYGIFKDGNFYGNWENGIWENGNFSGKWNSGINLTQI